MIDWKKVMPIPIKERKNKVSVKKDFKKVRDEVEVLEREDIRKLASAIVKARREGKKVIVMMGAHVIKTGMSPYIIDLMKRKFISHVALNGAGSIHDFEIAMIGETSESVEDNIKNGTFGMSNETGFLMNIALKAGKGGYGRIIGDLIADRKMKFRRWSILYAGHSLGIPVTVHAAIGTDIIHQHPACDGAAIGRTSYEDFRIFADSVSELSMGVVLNIGSAVILPEVFLKAIAIARNTGCKVGRFTAANMDMADQYRPRVNVVERPSSVGYNIIEKHEKTIPSLYKLVTGQSK